MLKRAPTQWKNGAGVEELQEQWIRTYNLIAQHKMLDEVNRGQVKGGTHHWVGSGGGGGGGGGGGSDPGAGGTGGGGGQMTTGQV